ncbi:MAG: S1 domain-containing post-transcriptional regulator GSP13 [Lysinibacillus sp.]
MRKKYEVGDVLTGKVTGIQPYGAFISLDEHTQGLVHISEITYGFVKDIHDYLKVGEEIQVKVLEVDDSSSKISLSIRVLHEVPPQRKKEFAPRKTLQEKVDESDANGFLSLKNKLQDWIDQSGQK